MFYLGHNNRVPYLSLVFEVLVQFVISTVKSRQISNIHTHRFLLKCKNHLILPTDQSKSPKNDKNIELELYNVEMILSIAILQSQRNKHLINLHKYCFEIRIL